MASLNSRIQLALLNRKKGKNLIDMGFTLVELMIVIVIVGVLSATALPQFLGVKDKAEIGSQIGEAAGLAKECSTAVLLDGPYPVYASLTPASGLTISAQCGTAATNTAPANDITYTSEDAVANKTVGTKCGAGVLAAGKACITTVNATTGQITVAPEA